MKKLTTKRLLSALLCMAMLLAMLPIAVFAAGDTVTVYFDNSARKWSTVKVYYWGSKTAENPVWPGIAMKSEGNNLYSYAIPTDATGVIFNNGNGGGSNQTGNLKVPTGNKVYHNGSAWFAKGEVVESYYVVAGDEKLCGTNWDVGNADNRMTKGSNGVYTKVFKNVAAGTYSLKVVQDGNWDTSWGGTGAGGNYEFTISATCDVTVTFDPSSFTVSVTGSAVGEKVFNVETITAVGNGSGAWLNGQSWIVESASNHMKEVSENVWEITYNGVAKGKYELKFAVNDSWTDNWGFYGEYEVGTVSDAHFCCETNIAFTVPYAVASVKLTLDLTKFDYEAKNGGTFKIEITELPSVVSQKMSVVSYRGGSTYTAPKKTGYVFAGWFTDANLKTPLGKTVKTGQAYAKFVPAAVLSVKWQVTAGTNADTAKTTMRLLTTVDGLKYASIGFKIQIGDGKVNDRTTSTVYSQIKAKSDGSVLSIKPTQVCPISTHFATMNINNIPSSMYETDFTVSAVWTTLDGTVVIGETRTFQVSDYYA